MRIMTDLDVDALSGAIATIAHWAVDNSPKMTCATCAHRESDEEGSYCSAPWIFHSTGRCVDVEPDHFCAKWEQRP